MTQGPTLIKKCSSCSKQIEQETIASGNTFGATLWTDGKLEAPMLPNQPWLVMCPHCHAPLWIDELEELGEVDTWGDNNNDGKFKDAKQYQLPSLEDYFALLEKGAETSEKERYIRLNILWTGNDLRRRNEKIKISDLEASNMTAFAKMLDESIPTDLLLKAELMRSLGRFDESKALLERSVDEDLSQPVIIIKKLVEKRDTCVRKIDQDGEDDL